MPKRDISRVIELLEAGAEYKNGQPHGVRMSIHGVVFVPIRHANLNNAIAILRDLDARTGTIDPRVKRERKRATRLARGEI